MISLTSGPQLMVTAQPRAYLGRSEERDSDLENQLKIPAIVRRDFTLVSSYHLTPRQSLPPERTDCRSRTIANP